MKKIYRHFLVIGIIALLVSCKKEESPVPIPSTPPSPTSSSESKLFVIDSAKVYQLSSTGTYEKTLVNRRVNTSSYIRDLSIGDNGSKFIYTDVQTGFNGTTYVTTQQIRIVDLVNNSDTQLLSTTDDISTLKYCEDGKIFFVRSNYTSNSTKFATMNTDGAGLVENATSYKDFTDISDNKRFLLLASEQTPYNQKVSVLDLNLDNGAGGVYHDEIFDGTDKLNAGVITTNGQKAIIPYRVNGELKIRILDLSTKTSTTKTIVSGLSEWNYVKISMAHDSNKGAIIISGDDFKVKSKVFLFKLDNTTITSFETTNEQVQHVYIY